MNMFETKRYDIQNVGNGPASLGVPLQLLNHNSSKTIGIVGPQDTYGAGNLDYQIEANSGAKDFLETIPYPLHLQLAHHPSTQALAALHENSPSLTLVAEFQAEVARVLEGYFQARQRPPLHLDDTVSYLQATGKGWIDSVNARGEVIARSIDAVIGIGARQEPLDIGEFQEKLVLSDDILKLAPEALASLCADKKVLIIGGAHSAFSVADNLHEHAHPTWVKVVHRSPVKPFYPSVEAALADGYTFNPNQVDGGKVNRFDGIRGRALAFYKALAEGNVSRFGLQQSRDPSLLASDLASADIVIQATGYTPNTLPIFDSQGRAINYDPTEQGENFGSLIIEGSQIFYNGLAVTNRDGVNLFQGEFARQILQRIQHPPEAASWPPPVRARSTFGVED